ncbi:hypothetical protein BG011_008311 [Mortierella polycephala]|uniref:Uncharacterized protein n=1 Tax=Mortierella polycephala TaxID=41804 RepID=A0A9P6TX62_9FUNG|nr:hypothetical protein BG011_008311 [Mortierella polycephala]
MSARHCYPLFGQTITLRDVLYREQQTHFVCAEAAFNGLNNQTMTVAVEFNSKVLFHAPSVAELGKLQEAHENNTLLHTVVKVDGRMQLVMSYFADSRRIYTNYRAIDLAKLVDRINQLNVRDLELDLGEFGLSPQVISQMRLGKGRYHSLFGLLSNTKIKNLTFANIDLVAPPRTSPLPSNLSLSLLQSFHYLSVINAVDDSRLAGIISHCPQLTDLRLGSMGWASGGVPEVDQAIGSLAMLQTLHRYGLNANSNMAVRADATPFGPVALRELVDYGRFQCLHRSS